MKHTLLLCALLWCGAGATAQNPYIVPEVAAEGADGVAVELPRTMLAVDITAESDETLSGPYARYAQKMLGVRAPLTDKKVWTVKSARVALLDAATQLYAAEVAPSTSQVASHARADEEFARVQTDKNDMTVQAAEDAARAAAAQIFSLRRHRLELITGEAGEHVFGEGLAAALAEIERLEQSYLELFLGKRVIRTVTRRYTVSPEADKRQYVVCRCSPAGGLLPESDLSGDMVLLQLDPSGEPVGASIEAGPKEQNTVKCRVADPVTCTVIAGGEELTRTVLPLFEFGRSIQVPLLRRK